MSERLIDASPPAKIGAMVESAATDMKRLAPVANLVGIPGGQRAHLRAIGREIFCA